MSIPTFSCQIELVNHPQGHGWPSRTIHPHLRCRCKPYEDRFGPLAYCLSQHLVSNHLCMPAFIQH